jgi:nicotinate-nucleotide adenylyltransferase
MHIAIFGGSFDPPHIGHQLACLYVLSTTTVDELWLVPTHEHAFGKPLTPFAHRFEMCRALAEPFGPRVRVSDIERVRGGVSRTADTVRTLRSHHPNDRFSWIVGADLLPEIPTWYDGKELPNLVDFIVVGRAGHAGGEGVAMPEVSSTEIRRRLATGQSCEHLVPRTVLAYIGSNGLYRS